MRLKSVPQEGSTNIRLLGKYALAPMRNEVIATEYVRVLLDGECDGAQPDRILVVPVERLKISTLLAEFEREFGGIELDIDSD